MKINIYQFDDYRPALRELLLAKKAAHGRAFTFDRLAKACRVQKSYLSRALGGHAHLSEDQVEIATDFLGVSEPEARYIGLAHAYQRAAYRQRRVRLKAELRAEQARSGRLESVLSTPRAETDLSEAVLYHLDPDAVLVHMFLTIPRFAENSKLIGSALGLSPSALSAVLAKLERLGLIRSEATRYVAALPNSHVSSESPLQRPHALLQRTKAFERLLRGDTDNAYNFSVVFSADEATFRNVKQAFLALLQEMQKQVVAASSDEVYQMNFDLFSWSG